MAVRAGPSPRYACGRHRRGGCRVQAAVEVAMQAVLLVVTLLSLTIAICTSVLAWRVMRNERLRSEARIAALTADLAAVDEYRTIRADRREASAIASDFPAADLKVRTTQIADQKAR